MKLILTEIHKKLNKGYLKQDLTQGQIEIFKSNLRILFSKTEIAERKKEHEEHFKNIVSDFLKDTYYKNNYEININKRKDLVIHNGKSSSDSVGVIIEAKKPSNESEMISQKSPNVKALHELLHYYLQERFINNNKEIKHIIATNSYDWYIFDAADFEKFFYDNKRIRKSYEDWNSGVLVGSNTDWFYNEVAKPYIEKELTELEAVHFNLLNYKEIIENAKLDDDQDLVDLYKILSPEHLLKKSFANDSNTLNKGFYNELLYIIGLEERPDGGKKLIDRKRKNRDDGSLLENTINILKIRDKLRSVEHIEQYGETEEEQLYSIGLELCITWLNRILFLKLLEGQLIKYHNGNNDYSFINGQSIKDFDELDELFFEVLAVKTSERSESVNDKFGNIPYLNSSLFEISNLESKTIQISDLKDRLELSIYAHSILKNRDENKTLEHKNTLQYLFEFLSAYNFSSDSSAKIQEDNKTIINASVLGLIFEKINGYKDGSFFTPGFITMYMSHETIRRAVVQKFKEGEKIDIETFEDLKNYCTKFFKKDDIDRLNSHINLLKICDPAVGSGHFLVSALNEVIAIKSELNILVDSAGTPLEYEITVANDELIIINKKTNKPFEYLLGADNKPPKALQQVQVTLFEEKQRIIENCLFGVDINPKSVLICRLRLWIELLKNAFYKPGDYAELETLPNIDINIKCGNSLINRFNLSDNHTELPPSTRQKIKFATQKYKEQVIIYKSTNDKATKRNAEKEIARLKEQFSQIANPSDLDYKKLQEKKSQLGSMPMLFSQEEKDAWNRKTEQLIHEIAELEQAYNQKIKALYSNTLEWRFEFPEVLNEDGDFVGFDVVIGNPPYIRQEEFSNLKHYLQDNFNSYAGAADLYVYFVERGIQLAAPKGQFIYILPNKWMRAGYGSALRKWVSTYSIRSIVDFGDLPVFEEAITYPCIWHVEKSDSEEKSFIAANIETLKFTDGLENHIKSKSFKVSQKLLSPKGWTLVNDSIQTLINKIKAKGIPLGEYVDGQIYRGVLTGFNEAFVIDETTKNRLVEEDPKSDEIIKPFLAGRDIKRYQQPKSDKFLIFTRRGINIDEYPAIKNYLSQFREKLEPKPNEFKGNVWNGRKQGSYKWYEIQDAVDYYTKFEKEKIIVPAITNSANYGYDTKSFFSNDKTSIISTNDKAVLGLISSKLLDFFLKTIASTKQHGYFEYKPVYVSQIPICIIEDEQREKISGIVNQILALKSHNPSADTTSLESEIDQLVYQLYGLTLEEIEIVENGLK